MMKKGPVRPFGRTTTSHLGDHSEVVEVSPDEFTGVYQGQKTRKQVVNKESRRIEGWAKKQRVAGNSIEGENGGVKEYSFNYA